MSDRELIAAAEYGRKLGLLDRTVNSADKTRAEHDFSLRFPTPFLNVVQRNAEAVGLDIAWAYGLIRQESRFIMDARSSAGAVAHHRHAGIQLGLAIGQHGLDQLKVCDRLAELLAFLGVGHGIRDEPMRHSACER